MAHDCQKVTFGFAGSFRLFTRVLQLQGALQYPLLQQLLVLAQLAVLHFNTIQHGVKTPGQQPHLIAYSGLRCAGIVMPLIAHPLRQFTQTPQGAHYAGNQSPSQNTGDQQRHKSGGQHPTDLAIKLFAQWF